MLYPAELRARHVTASGDSDYSGNFAVDEGVQWLADVRQISFTLIGPKYSPSRDFNSLLASLLLSRSVNVNLSHRWQFLPCANYPQSLYFQAVGIGKSDATIIGRRSGAQWGALEDKLRPEVFLDAPCIFPSTRFYLADGSPPQAPRWPLNLRQHKPFLNVQSRLSQQSRNYRLFEA
jgi:hypothetical protein